MVSLATNQPFIPECEVFYEGGPTSEELQIACEKNPGHGTFIPISQLKMEDIPLDDRNEETMNYIQYYSQWTVKVIVSYTSPNRPDTWPGTDQPYPYNHYKGNKRVTRCGTGTIFPEDLRYHIKLSSCPCPICDKSNERKDKYWEILVNTAAHVVFDELEAVRTRCECFYDSEDKEGVKNIYGIRIPKLENSLYYDNCAFVCVTHDEDLIKSLKFDSDHLLTMLPKFCSFLISHPHGRSKKITFGRVRSHTKVKDHYDPNLKVTVGIDEADLKCLLPLFPWSTYNYEGSHHPDDYVVNKKFKLIPGENNVIPISQAIPPSDANHIYSTDRTKGLSFNTTFPIGTRFYTTSSKDVFFPPECHFSCRISEVTSDSQKIWMDQYMTYDIDTCRGSSGAAFHSRARTTYKECLHAGSQGVGVNRSTIFGWDFTKSKWQVEALLPKE